MKRNPKMTAHHRVYHRKPAVNRFINPRNRGVYSQSRRFSLFAVLALAAVLSCSSFLHAQAQGDSNKVEEKVRSEMRRNRRATFFVVLRDQADLSQAVRIRDWKSKGDAVVNTLR